MGRKSAAPPPGGADVLYSRVITCDERDGLVRVEVASGDHRQVGVLPLRVAIELWVKLGAVIGRANNTAAPVCLSCKARELAN